MPLLRDADGRPLKRNFVHVDDLVDAILAALDNPVASGELYNVCMDEPVDYGVVAAYLRQDPRARLSGHPQPLSFDLDGQRQGEIRAGLAPALRLGKTD